MNVVRRWISRCGRWRVHARWLMVALAVWLAATGPALAQRKKKEEPVAEASKSYVEAYFLVMMTVAGGLFAALRPSSRLDKVPEKIRPDENEEE